MTKNTQPNIPWNVLWSAFGALVVVAIALGWMAWQRMDGPPEYVTATIGGEKFRLETCFDDETRARGMMGRTSIGENEGMVFAFAETRVRGFWMKDCLINLDIVYLDEMGRVVSFTTMKRPEPGTPDHLLPNYSSVYRARYAIELRAGRAAELGIKQADRIDLPLSVLKKWAR